jgi:hypothetical protein
VTVAAKPLRGQTALALVRDLAEDTQSQTALAKKYGTTQSAVSVFKKDHAGEVEALRAQLRAESVGLWISDKQRRLAEYQRDVEDVNTALAGRPDPDNPEQTIYPENPGPLYRAKHTALRNAAEELGELAPRLVHVSNTQVRYSVQGVDLEALR